ncbi:hypothetical protein B0T19DRAFT_187186 [Cercophora scortea]|uniref:Uncharacterized protein n=1 Tax=Cercophora scortea TaxID=314031 RepID=A0AAE0ME27_9PEZI|nr:hypothetical protein B0T19DRAFT_187186 [Cercophora scortea]
MTITSLSTQRACSGLSWNDLTTPPYFGPTIGSIALAFRLWKRIGFSFLSGIARIGSSPLFHTFLISCSRPFLFSSFTSVIPCIWDSTFGLGENHRYRARYQAFGVCGILGNREGSAKLFFFWWSYMATWAHFVSISFRFSFFTFHPSPFSLLSVKAYCFFYSFRFCFYSFWFCFVFFLVLFEDLLGLPHGTLDLISAQEAANIMERSGFQDPWKGGMLEGVTLRGTFIFFQGPVSFSEAEFG